jgi:chromosome segregation ATPase
VNKAKTLETEKCKRLSAKIEKLTTEYMNEIKKFKMQVEKLTKTANVNEKLESEDIKRKLEIEAERIYQFRLEKLNNEKSLETEKCIHLSTEIDKLKTDHMEEIKKLKIEIEKLTNVVNGNENEDIKRKLEIAAEKIGTLSLENDVLKADNIKTEKLLKAEILNLNKGISRKTNEIDRLKKESETLTKENSQLQENLTGVTKMVSESKEEFKNLGIKVDELKRDADLERAQYKNALDKFEKEEPKLRKLLKEGNKKVKYFCFIFLSTRKN